MEEKIKELQINEIRTLEKDIEFLEKQIDFLKINLNYTSDKLNEMKLLRDKKLNTLHGLESEVENENNQVIENDN